MERLIVQVLLRDEWKDFYFFPHPNKHGVFGSRFDINASEHTRPATLITLKDFESSYGTVRCIYVCPCQQLVIHTDQLAVMIRNGSDWCNADRVAFYPNGKFGDLLEQELHEIPKWGDECSMFSLSRFFSELNLTIVRHDLGTISMALEPDDALPFSEDPAKAATEPKTVFQATLWRDSDPSAILNFREDGTAFTQFSGEEEFKYSDEAEPWASMLEKAVTFWQHLHLESQGKHWQTNTASRHVI
jgi:hypothetical protein